MNRIFFTYERMEPLRYPEPRTIRKDLERIFNNKFKNQQIGKIPLATEFDVKTLKNKTTGKELVVLKYRIINTDWEITRSSKEIYDSSLFRWLKPEESDYGVIE